MFSEGKGERHDHSLETWSYWPTIGSFCFRLVYSKGCDLSLITNGRRILIIELVASVIDVYLETFLTDGFAVAWTYLGKSGFLFCWFLF